MSKLLTALCAIAFRGHGVRARHRPDHAGNPGPGR